MACGTAEPIDADRAAYVQAADGETDACLRIVDDSLRAECLAFVAESLAAADLQAGLRQCAAIPAGLWRDECSFLVCDAAAVSVADAKRCCADAGRYRNRCLGHAVTREVTVAVSRFAPGEEEAAWRAARDVSVRALGPSGEERAEAVMVRLLADREEGGGLTSRVCGTVPERICTAVYGELVVRAAAAQNKDQQQLVRPACAKRVSLERATSLGLPAWDDSLDTAVQTSFARMCRR